MLISQKIETKWSASNKKHYIDLGYVFTKIGDSLTVNVSDLPNCSKVRVICRCDYCGREYSVVWESYRHAKEEENKKDCCNAPKCIGSKTQESIMMKYGVSCPFAMESVREKTRQTNLEKYGTERPAQNQRVKDKAKETCLEKYGYESYGAFYSITHTKELNPRWKNDKEFQRDERTTTEYREWRKAVFSRDHYTCQCCGTKSAPHNHVELQAHHILNWKDNAGMRYDVDNGITLCEKCHMRFHSIYGKHCNTREQLDEFLNTTEKVC